MDKRTQLTILVILFFVTACIFAMVYFSKQKEYSFVLHYTSPVNGEDYRIDNRSLGSVSQYYVHSIVNNVEYVLPLRSDPWSASTVPLEVGIENILNRPEGITQLYLTQDPSLPELTEQKSFIALLDFGKILGQNEYGIYKIPTRTAFTAATEESIAYGLPTISCSDVSSEVAVVELRLGSQNRVYSKNGCVIVEGVDTSGLILAADRLAYHLLGVL